MGGVPVDGRCALGGLVQLQLRCHQPRLKIPLLCCQRWAQASCSQAAVCLADEWQGIIRLRLVVEVAGYDVVESAVAMWSRSRAHSCWQRIPLTGPYSAHSRNCVFGGVATATATPVVTVSVVLPPEPPSLPSAAALAAINLASIWSCLPLPKPSHVPSWNSRLTMSRCPGYTSMVRSTFHVGSSHHSSTAIPLTPPSLSPTSTIVVAAPLSPPLPYLGVRLLVGHRDGPQRCQ